MYHFFVEPQQIADGTAVITGQDVNHIRNVLRMKPGETVEVNDGTDTYICGIVRIQEDRVLAEVREKKEGSELSCRITLYQGLPKADKMETIIQKSVELGVYRIVPVVMKRCVVRLDEKKQETKRKRWQAIAESAAKQAKRGMIPGISGVLTFEEMLQEAEKTDHFLLPYEHAEGMSRTREVFSQIKPGETVGILIGPEGGFEQEETEQAAKRGAEVITLGRRILRTETAGPAVLAMLDLYLEQ